MRKVFLVALAVTAGLAAAGPGSAAAAGDAAQDSVIFAGGGTPVTNGFFFPGTGVENNGKIEGVPMQVERGSNVTFVNLDPGAVTNLHKIQSFKRRKGRKRKPLFQSPTVNGPGTALMITSHLKPGVYSYYCPIHSTMYGLIEVV